MKSFHQHMWHRIDAQDAFEARHAVAMCVERMYEQLKGLFGIRPERVM